MPDQRLQEKHVPLSQRKHTRIMTHGRIWHEIGNWLWIRTGAGVPLEVWFALCIRAERTVRESWQDDANPIAIGTALRIVL